MYALCVLGYNKWKMRKYAVTEAKEQEAEAELYPMLHKDDIPFGARALERGIEVEGIWNSNPNTPIPSPQQPATPVDSRPASPVLKSLPQNSENSRTSTESQGSMANLKPVLPAARRAIASELDLASAGLAYETPRPGSYSRASLPGNHKALPKSILMSPAREEAIVGFRDHAPRERRVSFHSRAFPSRNHPEAKDYRSGLDAAQSESQYLAAMTGIESHSSPEPKRASRFTSKWIRIWFVH